MKTKKEVEKEYDCYMVLVPHGVSLFNYADNMCPDRACYIISSPKNNLDIKVSMQGEKIVKKGRKRE